MVLANTKNTKLAMESESSARTDKISEPYVRRSTALLLGTLKLGHGKLSTEDKPTRLQ